MTSNVSARSWNSESSNSWQFSHLIALIWPANGRFDRTPKRPTDRDLVPTTRKDTSYLPDQSGHAAIVQNSGLESPLHLPGSDHRACLLRRGLHQRPHLRMFRNYIRSTTL